HPAHAGLDQERSPPVGGDAAQLLAAGAHVDPPVEAGEPERQGERHPRAAPRREDPPPRRADGGPEPLVGHPRARHRRHTVVVRNGASAPATFSSTSRCPSTAPSSAPIVLTERWLAPASSHRPIWSTSLSSPAAVQLTLPSMPIDAGSRPAAAAASETI